MMPYYSNWLAKRVWMVNQDRGHRGSPSSSSAPSPPGSGHGSPRPYSKREWLEEERRLAERGRKREEKLHRKWLNDRSQVQQGRDFAYLDDVFSGAMGVRLRQDHALESWEWCFEQVMQRVSDIGEKHGLDLDAYAAQHFPQHYRMEQGNRALRSGNNDDALAEYEKAVRIGGDETAIAYVNQSSAYLQQDRLEECITSCKKALQLNPRSAGAYFNLGQAFAGLGDDDKAHKYFSKALELDEKLRLRLIEMGFG